MNPHITFAALLALGLRGIKLQLPLTQPPLSTATGGDGVAKLQRLPKTLRDATERFVAKESKAREVLGDAFVDHFGATRVRFSSFPHPLPGVAMTDLLPFFLSAPSAFLILLPPFPPPPDVFSLRLQQNEWDLFAQAVTDWELRRYVELA